MNKHFKLLIISALFVIGGGDSLCFGQETTETPEIHDPAEWISGTLPVLYINTENSEEITSKDNYLTGTYYLDALGLEGYESVGSAEAPLALQIKGRGNASWKYDKKPYRLKLDKKAGLMGMTKSKHFVLLADVYEVQFRNDNTAFELSRRLGLDYTPEQHGIELVVNGDYRGFYYLCEKIRVDADHVNIVEQKDEETDPEAITGGWLVEIDNYAEDNQITITDRTNGGKIRFTPQTPEVLSTEQQAYLTNLVTTVDNLIYVDDKDDTRWTDYIDLDALARYYVLQEVMDNGESFSGSCYWHKDQGENSKIVFGPVWDFGSALCHGSVNYQSFIYDNVPSYAKQRWIGEIAKFPVFQAKVKEVWSEFRNNCWNGIFDYMDAEKNHISAAIAKDRKRWPQYAIVSLNGRNSGTQRGLAAKVAWLDQQWGTATPVTTGVNEVNAAKHVVATTCYDIDGKQLSSPRQGLNIVVTRYSDGSSQATKKLVK